MAVREDNYRIEVWDRDGKTLVETISRSPDFIVSMASWHAAVRRRPGMVLVHFNGERMIERMIAPSEPVEGAVTSTGIDAALRDLRSWHELRAHCLGCSHSSLLGRNRLAAKYGDAVMLGTIERMLTCKRCRRGPVRLEVQNARRD